MKVAILGLGDIARGQYLPMIRKELPGVKLVAFDPNDNAFLRLNHEQPFLERSFNEKELISSLVRTDYLFILSSSEYHSMQLLQASGISNPVKILCEKPIALTLKELQQLEITDR